LPKDTVAAAPSVPVAPLEVEKKPLDDEVLTVSDVVPLLVVLFPYWSLSWNPRAMFVVLEADADDGVGVMAT